MDKKFVVFVVFAIVTQNSVLLSSAKFDGFSEEVFAILDLLWSEDLAARSKSFEGFNLFFNSLKNGKGQTSYHQPSENVDLTVFSDALSTVAETRDINFHAASIIVGDCDLFDTALNESRAALSAVSTLVINAIASAQGETVSNLTDVGLVSVDTSLFDVLRYCLKDVSNDFEKLIGEVETKVKVNFGILSVALYKAIESYGILVSDDTPDENAISAALVTIELSRVAAISTAMETEQNIFSLYETYLIDACLNQTDIVPEIFSLRKSRKLISDKVAGMIKVLFIPIAEKLLEYTSETEIECDYPVTIPISSNETEAIAVSLLQEAFGIFLNTASATLPDSTDHVAVAGIMMPRVILALISDYYHGFALAGTDFLPHHLKLLAIESVKKLQGLLLDFAIDKAFEVIGNNEYTEARLAKLRQRMVNNVQGTNVAIFWATEVLAEASDAAGGASQDDLEKVRISQNIAIFEITTAAKVLSYANLYKVIVDHGY